jgi:hypothetical protein
MVAALENDQDQVRSRLSEFLPGERLAYYNLLSGLIDSTLEAIRDNGDLGPGMIA